MYVGSALAVGKGLEHNGRANCNCSVVCEVRVFYQHHIPTTLTVDL